MHELSRAEPDDSARQVQQVKNDKGNQEHSAPAHQPRGPRRLDISFGLVPDGARSSAHPSKLDRCSDVERYADEQDDPHDPEQLSVTKLWHTEFAEESRVRVDSLRSAVDLQIADH